MRMKAWVREALLAMGDTFRTNDSAPGEYQAKRWFRQSKWNNRNENAFIKCAKKIMYIDPIKYCTECWDTGCTCGGIGLAHHGPCCDCVEENPNWKRSHKE